MIIHIPEPLTYAEYRDHQKHVLDTLKRLDRLWGRSLVAEMLALPKCECAHDLEWRDYHIKTLGTRRLNRLAWSIGSRVDRKPAVLDLGYERYLNFLDFQRLIAEHNRGLFK